MKLSLRTMNIETFVSFSELTENVDENVGDDRHKNKLLLVSVVW